jgi:uncharacterized membrane protein YkoI
MISSKKQVVSALGLILTVAAANVFAYSGQELAKEANLGIEQARAIALKAHPGKIIDQELERERGGSGLRYSFDIRVSKIAFEVGVDAMTGAVLENKAEGPHPD